MGKSFLGLDYGGTLSFTMTRMGRGGTNLVTSFPEMTTDSSEYSKSGDLMGESVIVNTAKILVSVPFSRSLLTLG